MPRLLVLRPEPGASTTVDQAHRMGLTAVAAPLFVVEPVAWEVPHSEGFDGLLLTSVNAMRHAGNGLNLLRGLPVYAVGQMTAVVALATDFEIAATGEGGVDWLLSSIDGDLKLLHLCGADRRVPTDPRQEITPIIVYRSNPISTPDLSTAPGSLALIHSPRSGRRFAELVSDHSSISIAAISAAAAKAAGDGWKQVAVADQPSDEALLALAATLCNKPDPE